MRGLGIATGAHPILVGNIAAEKVQGVVRLGMPMSQVSYTEFHAHLASYFDRVEADQRN